MSTRTHWQIFWWVCAGVGIAVVTSAASSSGDEALAVEGAGVMGKNCPGPGAVTCKFPFLFVSGGYWANARPPTSPLLWQGSTSL